MGMFDTGLDFSDPNSMAMLGALSGLGQAGMPSRMPVPFGAAMGQMFGGAAAGAQQALQYRAGQQALQTGQATLTGKNLENLSNLFMMNITRRAFGQPPLTLAQMQSGKFDDGSGSQPQQSQAPAATNGSIQSAPSTSPTATDRLNLFGSGDTGQGSQPAPASAGAGQQGEIGDPLLQRAFLGKMFGLQPTDLDKALWSARQLPEGSPDRTLAEAYATHLAGGRYQIMRNGWAYDQIENKWIHNPDLGVGITGDRDVNGNITANVTPGELPALAAVKGTEADVEARKEKAIQGFQYYLQTGNWPSESGGPFVSAQSPQAQPTAKVAAAAPVTASGTAPKPQPGGAATDAPARGMVQTVIPPISQQTPTTGGEEYVKERQKQWADTENSWSDAQESNLVGQQRLSALMNALKATQSGAWATQKASINAQLKSAGFAPIFSDDPAEVQKALKDNFAFATQQIRAFTSRPAAIELSLATQNLPGPDLQPAANQAIGSQMLGSLQWEQAMLNDWTKAKATGWRDPQDFRRAWVAQPRNSLQNFVDAAANQIGPLAGMPGAAKPGSKPASPAVAPKASKPPQGKQANAFVNGKIYRDAQGNRATYQNGQWIPVQ